MLAKVDALNDSTLIRFRFSSSLSPIVRSLDFVCFRIPLGQKPQLAACPVIPPLFLQPLRIVSHKKVSSPFFRLDGKRLCWPRIVFAAIAELLDVSRTTVGTINADHKLLQ
jgi:hypothetical protein